MATMERVDDLLVKIEQYYLFSAGMSSNLLCAHVWFQCFLRKNHSAHRTCTSNVARETNCHMILYTPCGFFLWNFLDHIVDGKWERETVPLLIELVELPYGDLSRSCVAGDHV